ncbi:MAG: glycosyltransferase, partial [Nodosilinea sp.]
RHTVISLIESGMFTDLVRSKVHLAIVCPMANEVESAEAFVNQVLQQCQGFKSVTLFTVLDRVSTDGTLDILLNLAQRDQRLTVVWAPENRCVVDAYVRGYKEALYAGCDWILEIDAGFSHQPEDIPQFFEKMTQGYDCVFGSRFCSGGKVTDSSLKRRLISQCGTFMTNTLLGSRLKDMTSGFEIFTADTLRCLLDKGLRSRFHFFQTEIRVYCHRFQIVEVPIQYKAASPSVSSKALIDSLRVLGSLVIDRFLNRSRRAYRAVRQHRPEKLF